MLPQVQGNKYDVHLIIVQNSKLIKLLFPVPVISIYNSTGKIGGPFMYKCLKLTNYEVSLKYCSNSIQPENFQTIDDSHDRILAANIQSSDSGLTMTYQRW